jgi:hypothetical protein
MSLFALKLIALSTMTADHIGNFFFPGELSWSIVGRMAFPIFAWGIANGYAYTHDAYAYLSRLFIFAILSQVPFSLGYLYLGYDPTILNIFFTLTFGLLAIIKFEETNRSVAGYMWAIGIALTGSILGVDYGAYGVLMILFFHMTYRRVLSTILSQFFLFFVSTVLMLLLWHAIPSVSRWVISPIQAYALVALYPLALYTGEQGPTFSKWFYWYYPIHLTLLLIIALCI